MVSKTVAEQAYTQMSVNHNTDHAKHLQKDDDQFCSPP